MWSIKNDYWRYIFWRQKIHFIAQCRDAYQIRNRLHRPALQTRKIIGRLVGNTWYVEESSLLEHLAKNGLTSKHHGLRSSGSEGPPLFEHIAKNVEAPKHHGLTSFGDMINSEEKIGNADIYANSADLEKSESRLVLKSDERAEEVNLSEPLFPPLKKDKPIEVEIPKKEFQIENHEPIFVQPEAEELVSRSITRSPFVSAELFSKLATMTLSVAIAFSGYQLMSGNVKISSLLPNQASLAATLSSQIGDLSQTIRKDIARISELSQKSAALLSGGNRFFSPDFAYRNLFTDEKISKSMDESAARKKKRPLRHAKGDWHTQLNPLKKFS